MARANHFTKLQVDATVDNYYVYFGSGILVDRDLITAQLAANKACIITNRNISPLYADLLVNALDDIDYDVYAIPDGEQYKTQNTLTQIYDHLINNGHNRDTTIFALGGGVVGDIAAFAAATYQRGVRLVQVPTTLLAQVDSAIGGKTAINHKLAKNMIGSFYNPYSVISDISLLRSLPMRELRAGFAEIIKYGILVGGDFLHSLAADFDLRNGFNEFDKLLPVIVESCAIKARIVAQDAQETRGVRQLLNLGHTFAHAIEVATGFTRFLHGEAVAIGLYLAALLSFELKLITAKDVEFVDILLTKAGLPKRLPDFLNTDELIRIMARDKKNRNGQLVFIVINCFGNCEVFSSVNEDILRVVLDQSKTSLIPTINTE